MYTVFILYSETHNKIYIGYTSNLIERFKSHNSLSDKGHTIRYRPWKVIYCEHFTNKADAMKREKELKSGKGRQWMHNQIANQFNFFGFISA
jgi:putative endonuclease